MAPSPKISVCIPMYNAALFIKDCINSVLSQSFQDFELLVVDDGSTDNSCDIVKNIKDNRVRLIQNQHDYVGSLNLLLDEAKLIKCSLTIVCMSSKLPLVITRNKHRKPK